MNRKYKTAVIGSGAAGMAVALFLKRSGHEVVLFEKVENPGPVGAGVLIQPAGMYVLEQLGVLEKFLETGEVIHRLYGENEKGSKVLNLVYNDFHEGTYGLGIHRGSIFNILLTEVQKEGIEYRTGCNIDSLTRSNGNTEIFCENVSEGFFDAVILSDGKNSKMRQQLKVRQKVHDYKWGALWTIVEDKEKKFHGELRQVYKTTKNIAGLLPIGQHPVTGKSSVSLFWSLRQSRVENWRQNSLENWKKEVVGLYPEIECLLDEIHDQEQLLFSTYSHITMKQWHDENLVCIGDAAHAMSPQLGMGVSLGLYDAYSLCHCLNEKDSAESAFIEYTRRRRSHIRWMQFVSRIVTPMFQSSGSDWAPYRDFTFNQIHNIGFTYRLMLGTLSGVQRGILKKAERNLMDFLKRMPDCPDR